MSKPHVRIIVRTYFFGSDSSPGKEYQTLEYSDNTQTCDCKGWVFKKKATADGQRTCKHTRIVQCGIEVARKFALRIVEHSGPPKRSETRPFEPMPELPERAFDFSA